MSTTFRGQVFDDTISGASDTWYTAARFNDPLGTGDMLALIASVTDVSGSSPKLTVKVQHSADGRNWLDADTPISTTTIPSDGKVYRGSTTYWPTLLSFVRLKVSLSGTSPECRLKLFAASRRLF